MTRLSSSFPANRTALVTFITGDDPTPANTSTILDTLLEGGDKDIFTVAEALGTEI